jgi:predicted esterase
VFQSAVAFKTVPIFLSRGTTHQIARTAMIQDVEKSMKFGGFRPVRLESYEGAHEVYLRHTTEALQWFLAPPGAGPTPTSQSNFDQFFKKPPGR